MGPRNQFSFPLLRFYYIIFFVLLAVPCWRLIFQLEFQRFVRRHFHEHVFAHRILSIFLFFFYRVQKFANYLRIFLKLSGRIPEKKKGSARMTVTRRNQN